MRREKLTLPKSWRLLISLVILLSVEASALSAVRNVPTRDYPTIQSAIDRAGGGDEVVVAPRTYTGLGNVDLDFKKKAITVRSQINPDNPDWNIIAATIIDCGGSADAPHRAFRFHRGEGINSKVLGFTIRNGYARGPKGADGSLLAFDPYTVHPPGLYQSVNPADPNGPPRAERGDGSSGDGYGGAIFCEIASSPTIKYCVITNCTVTGGQGGRGANGQNGTWSYQPPYDINDPNAVVPGRVDVTGGQWGSNGGDGFGNGYGGGIACLSGSSPSISDCTIKDNFARGGCGGAGGAGGAGASTGTPPNYSGNGSFGGNAGSSNGDGMGGGIYCENLSVPNIVNCTFTNNVATTGARAAGGAAGAGTAIAPPIGPATNGGEGLVFPNSNGGIAGGAAYYNWGVSANFTNCKFTGNKAYEAYVLPNPSLSEDISAYTVGGALYSNGSNAVTLNTCDFIDNMGGAVYCVGFGSTLNINNDYNLSHKCLFTGNSDPTDYTDSDVFRLIGITGIIDFGSGGAVYIGSSSSATIRNCIFGGNSAKNDGGALKSESGITLQNCSFGSNTAQNGYGGGADVYTSGAPAPLGINVSNCSFSGNQSMFGGGLSSENFNAIFTSCYFIGNTAERSGGLDLVNGNVTITGSVVKDNIATGGNGGGLNCQSTIANISHSTFAGNLASGVSASGGCGGAIYFDGLASTQQVFNCLITGNSATVDGGAIYSYNATPEIKNCTFDDDFAGGFGGAIFSGWNSLPQIINCIFSKCSSHAIHEENGGDAHATYCLFYDNYNGEYYDSGMRLVYKGAGQVGSIPGGSHNLYGDPLFVNGDLGGYYLSQIAAGQGSNSPAVDSGSGPPVALGLNTYTTRTDNVVDAGLLVDIGYHHYKSSAVVTFHLTASVVGGHGTVAPTSPQPIDYNSVSNTYRYYAGTIVTLTATPNPGWLVKTWTGTDDDSSTKSTNTVVMYADRTVTVEFRQPRTLIVSVGGGQQGYYPDIQSAVIDADNGDTIVVYPGNYYSGYLERALVVDRSVIITSRNPDDPCCVAATIIDGLFGTNPWVNWGILFTSNSTGAVLNGLTIRNCGGLILSSLPGDRGAGHPNGYDGGISDGAAIHVQQGAGPTIKNCVIRNNQVTGGNGGNGVGATTTANAGRGGWGGWVHGGAIYCAPESSPRFINCRITNNNAIGGNGGNGGNDVDPGGEANYGGNWSRAASPGSPALDIDPLSLTITPITSGNLWERWTWDYGNYYWSLIYGQSGRTSYIGDYRWYSGYGGGAYCDVNSSVTFIDCQISGNVARGGMSGQGGLQAPSTIPLDPLVPYEIPSFGGGVYCAAGATVTFTGCTIANNTSSPPVLVNPADPASGLRFRLDPYLGHGGGVCAEDTANVAFNNCTFSQNEASVGGGFNWANANPAISDCNFTFNSAFQGGGLFGQHGPGTIIGCNITNNTAVSDPNVGEILGAGGGIHCWATDVNIVDCNISSNQAETSGGGVYFGGENYSSLINCLITKNLAGRDGGGVSANIYSDVNIANCTIADNIVGGQGYGGGLYSSDYSYVDIIDSIIWGNKGNIGAQGSQLAIATGDKYAPTPSLIKVKYSDVQDATKSGAFGARTQAVDLVFCIDTTSSMGDDIAAVKAAANQIVSAIATKMPDYKIAVVDYRDFNTVPYGDTTDYPYKTDSGFTKNTAQVVSAINSLVASGGGDGPESVYTVLMHCIDHNSLRARLDPNYYGANPAWRGPGDWRAGNVMRVIILVTDAPPHDPEPFTNYTLENIVAAAGGAEQKVIIPVLIAQDTATIGYLTSYFGSLANQTGGAVVQAANAGEVVGALMNVIDLISRIPDPILVNTGGIFNWNHSTFAWDPGSHNIDEDPLFVEGYFLSQKAAGQSVDSKCVDAGHTDANTAGMYRHTTRTDLVIESPYSLVDLGYHYVRKTEFVGDLNYDGIVNGTDWNLLLSHWLDQCEFPNWCDGADLNEDGIVNFEDEAIFENNRGKSETTPPVPNPMTWEIRPTSAPTKTYAEMTATKATDAYGGSIEYYIQRTDALGNPDGFYRDWDQNRAFTNTDLVSGKTYGYRVKARDARHNETGWSAPIEYVTVGKESPPSAPTNLAATAVSQTQINLTWTDTSNETGFKIERITGGSFTLIATVAANVNTYNNTGLTAGTTYTYHVIAYNTGGDSPYSNEASATTQSGGGGGPSGEPNQPIMIASNVDPNSSQTKGIDTYWYHTVVATVPGIGGAQPVWFKFVCNSYSAFSSPWISDAGPFPMNLQHPISSAYPVVVVTVNGTTVTYRIMVKQGGSSGWGMSWKVCASFNADGSNSSCSANLTIPWH